MKKAQVSITVVLGILAVFLVITMFYLLSQSFKDYYKDETQDTFTFNEVKSSIEDYINLCIKDSMINAIQDTGIREENVELYKGLVSSKIDSCLNPILDSLESQDYIITRGEMKIKVKFNPETIVVDLSLPLLIEKNSQQISIDDFHSTFDRSVHISVPNGIADRDITLTSSDGRAILKIPKGVKLVDSEGNPVENIGIKVEDRHFDGLENRYVLGQTVYDNFPDGTKFSQPVEFTIEFREKDIPEGYTKENIRIAWWNEDAGLWFAGETQIEGTRSITNITHFSSRADVLGEMNVQAHRLFEQRFAPIGTVYPEGGGDTWVIGGKTDLSRGTATLKDPQKKSIVTSSENDFRKIKGAIEDQFIVNYKVQYGYYKGILDPDVYLKNLLTKDPSSIMPLGPYLDANGNILGSDISQIDINNVDAGQTAGYWDFGSDSNFVDCEVYEEKNTDKIEYVLEPGSDPEDAGNLPYFYINGCAPYYCSNDPADYETGNDECMGDRLCYSNTENSVCLPVEEGNILYLSQNQKNGLPCVSVSFEEMRARQNSESPKKVFGWHDYHCVGGRVRPMVPEASDETGSSDLLVFEPNGNGVLLSKYGYLLSQAESLAHGAMTDDPLYVEIPNIGVIAFPSNIVMKPANDNLEQINEYNKFVDALMVMQNKEDINLMKAVGFKGFDDNGDPVFEVNEKGAVTTAGGEQIDSTEFVCSIIGNFYEVALSDSADSAVEQKLGITSPWTSPAYGIKGVNVLKLNHKDQMQAYCDVVWYFWGNGVVDHFPDIPERSG